MFLLALLASATALPDLGRWNEASPPGAPFRIDMPQPLTFEGEKDNSGVRVRTWKTNYGLMSVQITHSDRPGKTSFSARQHLEMLGGGLVAKWVKPTANVSDLTILGRTAAKLDIEHEVDGGRRIRTERLLIRDGDDDWTVQTTRFAGSDDVDSAHIFASIRPPAPPPVLVRASIGRMSLMAPGKPVVTVDKLQGEAAKSYDKWVTYAFNPDGKTKIWIYNIRMKGPGSFNSEGVAQQLIDSVAQQSNPKVSVYPFPYTAGGLQGVQARGQAITGEGEEAFRILAVADGPEGWAMLAAGPNIARSEAMFREMIDSIQVAR